MRPDENSTSYSRKAELLLERFPRHGERWKAREIQRETEGAVSGSYVGALLGGKINRPGDELLFSIAEVLGFPPELWGLEPPQWDAELASVRKEALRSRREAGVPPRWEGTDPEWEIGNPLHKPGPGGAELAGLLDHLFRNVLNPRTGRPYTERQVAIHSGGRLTLEEIRRMRSGDSPPTPDDQLLALSDAFEVAPTYWWRASLGAGHDAPALRRFADSPTTDAVQREVSRGLYVELPEDFSEEQRNDVLRFIDYVIHRSRDHSRGDGDQDQR